LRAPGGVDLHVHSDASDGVVAPAEVARRAARAGLSAIALSDHDTTSGWAALRAAAPAGLRLIPAIELTCRVRADRLGTVHVLGYGVDPASAPLEAVARRNRLAKRAQVEAILARLAAEEGIAISWAEVAGDRGPEAYVGRNHVASILVARGVVRERRKAFRRFLASQKLPPVEVAPAGEALAAIHAAAGLAVLAHPTDRDLKRHLGPLRAMGLDGIEVHRPRAVGHLRERVERAARRHGLLVTGGSDWHGRYPDPPLGTWRVPEGVVSEALARLEQTVGTIPSSP